MVEVRKGVDWYDAGYTDIVSVIPPDASLLPRSKLSPDARGKAPGLRYGSGLWGGYAWQTARLSRDEVARVDATGANIGLRAARFPAIDIDVTDPALAQRIAAVVEAQLGATRYRVGLPPKRLYPFHLSGPEFSRIRVEIREAEKRHLVEVLGRGQQYVVGGTHPSGRAYEWSGPLLPASQLPELTRELAEVICAEIASVCRQLGYIAEVMSVLQSEPPSDVELRAPSAEELRFVVERLPNTLTSHPSREDYIRVAAAIKAAGGDFDLFFAWASKWPGRDGKKNTPEQCRRDWDSLHSPYKVGWEWLLDQARAHGVNTAQVEFAALDEAAAVEEARVAFPNSTAFCSVREPVSAYADLWLADRFVRKVSTLLRFIVESKSWLVWNGATWIEDKQFAVDGILNNFLVDKAAELLRLAKAEADEKKAKALVNTARQLQSAPQINRIKDLVQKDARLAVRLERLDQYPLLLNTPDGAVDLRTGERLPADPCKLLTHNTLCPVDFAPPEKWLKFLRDVTRGDEEFQRFLQKMAGYIATGLTNEQVIFFVWGTGGNGKSVFVHTLQKALGSYASSVGIDVLLERSYGHPVEMAVLRGQRLAVVNETPSSRQWNEARLKLFAGGDIVSARFLYGAPFSFPLTSRLVIVGNAKPVLSDVDEAVRRRLRLVPFVFRPPEPNPRLMEELHEELPRILGWIVRGAVMWANEGLGVPLVVQEESTEYVDSADMIGSWLLAVRRDPEGRERTVDLYEHYRDWCISEGEIPVNIRRFSSLLQNRGLHKRRNGKGQFVFEGLRLPGKE
jgi:putative DNA primase/helicase